MQLRNGRDGIELNYDLESDLSPDATSADFAKIRKMADEIGIETNGFLMSPLEMCDFVDQFSSDHVKVHYDPVSIMEYQFLEHMMSTYVYLRTRHRQPGSLSLNLPAAYEVPPNLVRCPLILQAKV